MGRSRSAEEVIELADDPSVRTHSLARWVEDADARLSEERVAQAHAMDLIHRAAALLPDEDEDEPRGDFRGLNLREAVFKPLLDWATEHPRLDYSLTERGENLHLARARRPRAKHGARWDDELQALRAIHSPRQEVSGTGRATNRIRLGVVDLSGGKVRDPNVPDPHVASAWACFVSVPDAVLLRLAYVEVDEARLTVLGRDGRTTRIVPASRLSLDEGERVVGSSPARSAVSVARQVREREGALPFGSSLEASARTTAAQIVAEASGAMARRDPISGKPIVDESRQPEIARAVGKKISAARRVFRAALRAVELDVRPALLIPRPLPPTRAQIEAIAARGPRVEVDCCSGFVVVAGVREPCRSVSVSGPESLHPSSAWPPCDACGLPVVPARRRA